MNVDQFSRDSQPFIDDDPTPVMPDEVIVLPPCEHCGEDICEHDRAARDNSR